jgi:hypothetical protein
MGNYKSDTHKVYQPQAGNHISQALLSLDYGSVPKANVSQYSLIY